jgi:hypothetical protein
VASVLGSYLTLWVCSIPMPKPEQPGLLASSARFPLPRIQEAMRTFLQSYVEAAGLDPEHASPWLHTTVQMTGAHLIQTAYEHASAAGELVAQILTLVQLALNVLDRPEHASRDLIGMDVTARHSLSRRELARA